MRAWQRLWPLLTAAVVLAGCGGGTENAQRHFDDGAEHFQNGQYDDALEAYGRGLEVEPNSAVGHNLMGMAYRMKYNSLRDTRWKEQEIDAFRSAVAADSTFWPAHINLGATLYYMGKKTEAAHYFRTALRLHPDNPEREQLEAFIREGDSP